MFTLLKERQNLAVLSQARDHQPADPTLPFRCPKKAVLCRICLEVLQDFTRHDTGQVPILASIEEAFNYNSVMQLFFRSKRFLLWELKKTSNKNRTRTITQRLRLLAFHMSTVTTLASLGRPAFEVAHRDGVDYRMPLPYEDELECMYLFYRWEPILYIRP